MNATAGSASDRRVPRLAAGQLAELAAHLRIVMLAGPRQSGKTTLLRQYLDNHGGSYRSLDRPETLSSALSDPVGFATYGAIPRGVDEVQLGGDELVRAIKVTVDEDPRPGRYLLSGSSRFLTIPTLSESLAGRVVFVDLWPLSMVERTKAPGEFLRKVFGDPSEALAGSTWTRQQYVDCVTAGGYPEVLSIDSDIARRAWYESYLSTVINRDIQNFATITRADAIAKLLRLITSRAGSLAVVTDLAQGVEMTRETTKNYLSYLDMVYLTMSLPPWSTNHALRLVKTPKLYATDSGLAAHLLGADSGSLAEPGHAAMGPLVETFVAGELLKACSYSDKRIGLFHLRTSDKHEVDFMLEGPGGRVVAVEVKASTSPGKNALRELRWLRTQLGDRMHAGILLHLGAESASHGDGIYTMPLSALWDHEQLQRGRDSLEP